MIDFRLGGLAAAGAFILSLMLGLFSGTTMPLVLFRPFLFALIFFFIINLAKYLISRFLPDLLDSARFSDNAGFSPGSRVNIRETFSPGDISSREMYAGNEANARPRLNLPNESMGNIAIPKAQSLGSSDPNEGIGNISDLIRAREDNKNRKQEEVESIKIPESSESGESGMDQNMEMGYNGEGLEGSSGTESSEGGGGEIANLGDIPMWDFEKGIGGIPIASVGRDNPISSDAPKAFEASGLPETLKVPETLKMPEASMAPENTEKEQKTGQNFTAGTDILPDLDSMAGVFNQSSSHTDSDNMERFIPDNREDLLPSARPSAGSSSRGSDVPWSDNFNPKDIAMGLQTILSKEKEG